MWKGKARKAKKSKCAEEIETSFVYQNDTFNLTINKVSLEVQERDRERESQKVHLALHVAKFCCTRRKGRDIL